MEQSKRARRRCSGSSTSKIWPFNERRLIHLITAAALALASDDALGSLKRVGLREDPPALPLRGIAMAQLDDLVRTKSAFKKAARVLEAVACARSIVAEAKLASYRAISAGLRRPSTKHGRRSKRTGIV